MLPDAMARTRFAQMLREEYKGVDSEWLREVSLAAGDLLLRLRWWDAGGIRRLRPDAPIIVETKRMTFELPFNPCVGDLVFGANVYAMRARFIRNEVNLVTGKPLVAPPEPPTDSNATK